MRPQEKKEHCFLVCFNNVKKPLGAVRSRGSTGVCGSAGCLLGATRVVGTLGHARSVLGDVRPGARAQCGRGRGMRARERLQLPHTQPGGGQKGQFLPVRVCAPLCGQGTVKPPRCVGQWPERVCSWRGAAAGPLGCLHQREKKGTERGVPGVGVSCRRGAKTLLRLLSHFPGWLRGCVGIMGRLGAESCAKDRKHEWERKQRGSAHG